MEKRPYCIYDPSFDGEKSIGALRMYIPTNIGYINYNISHSVHEEITCDMWRLTFAYACDDDFKNSYSLTPTAEWDMALWLNGRDDFIGGQLHGDEIYTGMKLFVDGCEKKVTEINDLLPFHTIHMQVDSIGYDPNNHKTAVLKHRKNYEITSDGVTVDQHVEWLGDYDIGKSYLAMMPPLKIYTDSYYTDVDPIARKIDTSNFDVANCKSATLFGTESKLSFTMSVPKYPYNENMLWVRDNGRGDYNKMYFPVCTSVNVKQGEVWESRTEYKIKHG